MLSNLKKWSQAIPTISSFLTKAPTKNLSRGFLNLAPTTNSFFLQTKSLSFLRNENFGALFKIRKAGPCLSHRGRSKKNSPKRRQKRRAKQYRLPLHQGLMKRIRVV